MGGCCRVKRYVNVFFSIQDGLDNVQEWTLWGLGEELSRWRVACSFPSAPFFLVKLNLPTALLTTLQGYVSIEGDVNSLRGHF